jgi:hypothetical protein
VRDTNSSEPSLGTFPFLDLPSSSQRNPSKVGGRRTSVNVGLNFSRGHSLYPVSVLKSGGQDRVHAKGEERARMRQGERETMVGVEMETMVGVEMETMVGMETEMMVGVDQLGVRTYVREGPSCLAPDKRMAFGGWNRSEWTWRREEEGERQAWMGWKYTGTLPVWDQTGG